MSTCMQIRQHIRSPGLALIAMVGSRRGGNPALFCQTVQLGHLEPWAQSQGCDHDPTGSMTSADCETSLAYSL